MKHSPNATNLVDRRVGRAFATSIVMLATACAGCATSTPERSAGLGPVSVVTARSDFEVLAESMRIRNRMADRGSWFRSLDEAYSDAGQKGAQTEVVVVGNVVDASEGRAFISFDNPAEGAADSSEVPWSDTNAMWRTVHLRVKVKEVVGGGPPDLKEIQVGLVISGVDPESAIRALKSLGRVGIFLGRSPVFSYDPALYWVVGDGALLALPTKGKYELPFLDPVTDIGLLDEPRLSQSINAA
jgi:hypothetical protein